MVSKVKAKSQIEILDVGAGTGILSAALVEKLLKSKKTDSIEITLYENDARVIPVLNENIKLIKKKCESCKVILTAHVIEKNFILHNSLKWNQEESGNFDIVISNPPYKKIGKDSSEAKAMKELIYGQPNIYFLCMAMGAKMLNKGGDFIYIIPRSWTSGLYFRNFRAFFLKQICLKNIHLFVSRDKVFDKESVLQETMIVIGKKSQRQSPQITITTSNGTNDFNDITTLSVRSKICISKDENHFVLLPVCEEDISVLNIMSCFQTTLEDEGYIFKTGQVVEFRNQGSVCKTMETNCIPLIRPFHFRQGFIKFPIDTVKNQYIKRGTQDSLYMHNTDMLLLKRFTTKEEPRRLQAALHLAENLDLDEIAIENHVNYLAKKDVSLTREELYGLWGVLSSSIWDQYYRILNGSTQVNATEVNAMPVPTAEVISKIGKQILLNIKNRNYDNIIQEVLYGENRGNANNS